jgi:predicted enzyme related to lactoylglutathione lyase
MALEIRNVTIDCHDLDLVSGFWQAALGWPERVVRDRDALVAREGWGFPRFAFQEVPESKQVKNRVHVDLTADDMEAEVARLGALGATAGRVVTQGMTWTVMQDPEGNEFCVAQRPPDDD